MHQRNPLQDREMVTTDLSHRSFLIKNLIEIHLDLADVLLISIEPAHGAPTAT